MAKKNPLRDDAFAAIYQAALSLCKVANECERDWRKLHNLPETRETLHQRSRLANSYGIKAGEILVTALDHGALPGADAAHEELRESHTIESGGYGGKVKPGRDFYDRLYNRLFLNTCQYWLSGELSFRKLIDDRQQTFVHFSTKPGETGIHYAAAMRWLAVLLVPCIECRRTITPDDLSMQRATCHSCRSPIGKVADLLIALRASGDHPKRISQWLDIKYLTEERWGEMEPEKLADKIEGWLRNEHELKNGEALKLPLDDLVSMLKTVKSKGHAQQANNIPNDASYIASTPGNEPYLNCIVDPVERTITRNGKVAELGTKKQQWKMAFALFEAGIAGLSRDDLKTLLYTTPKNDSALDSLKAAANQTLLRASLEISTNNRAIWTLVDMSCNS